MAAALAHPVSTALGPRANALHGGAFVHKCFANHKAAGIHRVVVGRISNCAREHLANRLTGRLGCERQYRLGVCRIHPSDEVDDAARLHGRDTDVPRLGPGFHRYPLASRCSVCGLFKISAWQKNALTNAF